MSCPPLPPVSVVIAAREAAAGLEAAVASVRAQDYAGPLETVVALAPSGDATAAVAHRLSGEGGLVVVANPDGTTPAGLNRAVAAASGEVIVRLDAHSRLAPGHVHRAVELLAETGVANVGGPQAAQTTGGFAACVADAMRSRAGSGGATYRVGTRPGPADTVYLGAFRRDALEAVGGFDEALPRNQDYDLNWRLRDAGHTVWFHPDLAVAYTPRDSVRGLWRQYYDYGRWKRRMLVRQPRSVRLRQLAAPAIVLALAGSVAASLRLRCRWPMTLPAAYAAGITAAGAAAAGRAGRVPGTALALAVMHLAWGLGFLTGRAAAPPAPPLRPERPTPHPPR
ncbi:MAG: glycosyltransferase [Nitriliruptorales bacterium]|nr:glycosyltransferase [Nitriliruptorales bacterium]